MTARRALAVVVCALVVAGCEAHSIAPPVVTPAPAVSAPVPSSTPSPKPVLAPPSAAIAFPPAGSGQWLFPGGEGPVAGQAGRLLRYRVAVEADVAGVSPDGFAQAVESTLSDPRGWTGGGRWRLQRVGPDGPFDFTLYLATPKTRDVLCGRPDGYTSCRNGNSVVLNVARWANGVPGYGAPLTVYRQYMVTHEVGHRLGRGHETCPVPGALAPVMQQQTLGLHGCAPNPWPYPDGTQYSGPSGEYDDPIPRGDS
ncbi:DUF3152 domain-containing protein [Amycolatopsis sp. BJA-103]|uniref:DUF3152 domain-containing protein n=1 Tax=unclassified Amycolatopsis TaxID=2618356 RepID=UPI000C777995|nr:DUF3152 domain-containing protein [Amycolatopsis sp. BJA-103]AUI63599.1 hypothetical protein BKN51_39220 [Amycolatopsis sp. BJA-103]PNE19443.1 hypothetical protein B1H26_16935 [Amycolatopsis sp. BJA-103]